MTATDRGASTFAQVQRQCGHGPRRRERGVPIAAVVVQVVRRPRGEQLVDDGASHPGTVQGRRATRARRR
jgi:hypothetical protein